MTDVYISIGSNIDREKYIHSAVSSLEENFGHLTLSSVYDTAAVGFEGDDFLNLIASFETTKEPKQVDLILDNIETLNGRTPENIKFSARTLDLDLILFGDYVSNDPALSIPRDEVLQYAFMLEPLAEIAGELIHPIVGKTYSELWRVYDKNNLIQKRIDFDFKTK
jgi:2-amino-4-hydroxy-6-hydroxymethyldihydropteridine diphosphokinase